MNSLNVPAIRLLEDYSASQFIEFLSNTGFESIAQNKTNLGLSLILGGCGVTLHKLTRLYSAFANKGRLKTLNYLQNDNEEQGKQVFSEEASYLIAQILSKNERPDFPAEFLDFTDLPKIAWKTGTSYGKRDAWAVGFNPRYTIGVWMGNFSGEGSPYISGADIAVPLLFELFNSIDKSDNTGWFQMPDGLTQRKVCAETGLLPSRHCDYTINNYAIEDVSSNETCDLYRTIFVNQKETMQYCPECLPKDNYKKAVYPFYPPELLVWYETENIAYESPPEHNPKCTEKLAASGPKIISPTKGYEYYLEKGGEQKIMLQAASPADVKTQYWYINDKFYKKGKPEDKFFFKPSNEEIKVTCLDDKGRKSTVVVRVKYY
jgi:penicillin-binding protein 1C